MLPKIIEIMGRVKQIAKRDEIREKTIKRSGFSLITRKSPTLYVNFEEMRHPSIAKNDKSRDGENILCGLKRQIAVADTKREVTVDKREPKSCKR